MTFEQHDILQEVFDMLPKSSTNSSSVIHWKTKEEGETTEEMNTILLTKESEIAALKEVIAKWKNRALEAESSTYFQYFEELAVMRKQHENEMKALEARYIRKLNEKDDAILNLKEQVDYLIVQQSNHEKRFDYENERSDDDDDIESFVSFMDADSSSIASSVYDRELEQGLVHEASNEQVMKSETVMNNIQNTMRAIESELLNTHNEDSTLSSSTLTSCLSPSTTLVNPTPNREPLKKKKGMRKAFSIHRIFKKAFPKLRNGQPSHYRSSKNYSIERVGSWYEKNPFILQ